MNREQAEKLLAALIFDDLDEPSRAGLLAYLQTDDELRDRLADMRMALKLTCDAVNDGPDPVLSEDRLKALRQLARGGKPKVRIFTAGRFFGVAAVLLIGLVLAAMVSRNFVTSRAGRGTVAWNRQMGAAAVEESQAAPSGGVFLAEKKSDGFAPSLRTGRTESMGRPLDERDGSIVAGMGEVSDSAVMPSAPASSMSERSPSPVFLGRRRSDPSVQFGQQPETSDPVKASASAAAPAGSEVASDKRQLAVSGDVEGLIAAGERVPILGDKPIIGQSLRSELEIKNLDAQEGSEVRDKEGLSGILPTETETVRLQIQPEGQATPTAEEVLEPNATEMPARPRFQVVPVNPWVMTDRDPQSTFALDVDTASYALCRRYIQNGFLPPVGAVRMEEFINAFDYAYPQRDNATFAVHAEGAPSPFAPAGQDLTLLKVAVKARTVGREQRKAAHIVFVVDASASMGQADRLPQVQAALNLLVDKLSETDRISLVTCADQARLHLEAVPARQKDTIRQTIDAIQPAGPTNLLAGLKVGYEMARRAFAAGQINQVVLCSDGVANVGQTEAQGVLDAVAEDRKQGITLTCVGVGYGAYNDAFLEALADRGDGRYVFLDSFEQARQDLVGQLASTLQIVAKDARIQVQFNSARVRRYRLIGYENRDIEDRRFRDDTVDAGEVGSGQCSTALYELELAASSSGEGAGELGTVFVRYRNAESGFMEEISGVLAGSIIRRQSIEENPRFFLAAGAARFAEWLRQSEHARDTSLASVQAVLDRVGAVLSLDRSVQDLAALAHQAENLPRAPEPASRP